MLSSFISPTLLPPPPPASLPFQAYRVREGVGERDWKYNDSKKVCASSFIFLYATIYISDTNNF
jgi:hypothetical protein